MLSQLLFDKGDFIEAANHAAAALQTLYDWGGCWDKRQSFAQWVGFARMAHLRASRRGAGLGKLPSAPLAKSARPDAAEVTYLQDVLAGFEELTERPQTTVAAEVALATISANATAAVGRSRARL